jgi:hypothetical protein
LKEEKKTLRKTETASIRNEKLKKYSPWISISNGEK